MLKLLMTVLISNFVWAVIVMLITNTRIYVLFSTSGTVFLGIIYGFVTILILNSLFVRVTLLKGILGLLLATVVAYVISALILVPACYLSSTWQHYPAICVSVEGPLLGPPLTLIGHALVIFIGSFLGSLFAAKN